MSSLSAQEDIAVSGDGNHIFVVNNGTLEWRSSNGTLVDSAQLPRAGVTASGNGRRVAFDRTANRVLTAERVQVGATHYFRLSRFSFSGTTLSLVEYHDFSRNNLDLQDFDVDDSILALETRAGLDPSELLLIEWPTGGGSAVVRDVIVANDSSFVRAGTLSHRGTITNFFECGGTASGTYLWRATTNDATGGSMLERYVVCPE